VVLIICLLINKYCKFNRSFVIVLYYLYQYCIGAAVVMLVTAFSITMPKNS
jgi:hypothetical protein